MPIEAQNKLIASRCKKLCLKKINRNSALFTFYDFKKLESVNLFIDTEIISDVFLYNDGFTG